MKPFVVTAVISILCLFTASAEAGVILQTEDGNVLSWENYSEEGTFYCTRKGNGEIFCVPKTEILSVNKEGPPSEDINNENITPKTASDQYTTKEKLFTGKEADETGVSKVIEYIDNNGKIAMRKYLTTDRFADKKGYNRMIDYFDNNGKETKKEFFSTAGYANENGYMRSIIYSDSKGNQTKTEFYYTGRFADKNGYERMIDYSDSNGYHTKTEYFYTDKFGAEHGYNRLVDYLDGNETAITKTEFYMNDRLIKTSYK